MSKKNMLTPLWTPKDVSLFYKRFGIDPAEILIYQLLQRTGEEFVKVARESGRYIDHTGNLRSSIGYVIVRDGTILSENYMLSEKEGTDKRTGMEKVKRLARELAFVHNKGFVLIGMAGMEYAAHVEAIENKDVISMANVEAEEFIKKESRILFNRLRAA